MRKKMVSLLLCAAMALGCLTACGDANTSKEKTNEAESKTQSAAESKDTGKEEAESTPGDEIPVDYFAGTEIDILWQINGGEDTLPDKPIFKMVEEATGIKANIINIEPGAAGDVVATTLASDDRPDVYLGGCVSKGVFVANRDMFYDLSEEGLLETYAPNIVDLYNQHGGVWPTITWSDGGIYSLANSWSTSFENTACGILMINKDWLDRLGLDVPTTRDEYLDCLRAFRDEDANGNGDPDDEIPFGFQSGWGTNYIQFMDYFGIGVGPNCTVTGYALMLQDGKVQSTYDTENFRAFMEFYALMTEEGLLDTEGFAQNSEQFRAKKANDLHGSYFEWIPSDELKGSLVPVVFEGIEGVAPVVSGYGIDGPTFRTNAFMIDCDSENVEAVLHWFNWMHKDAETRCTANRGEQGKGWDFNADGTVYEYNNVPYTTSSGREVVYSNDINGMSTSGVFLLPNECTYPKEGLTDPNNASVYRQNMLKAVEPYAVKEILPSKFVSAEADEERVFIEQDLFAYIGNFITTNILDGLTDAEWDAHLKALEDNGYYKWLEWYQKYMDGEL